MAKTNSGLVAYCKAQKGKPYWFGTYGQKASKALYNAKKKQYPKYYKWNYSSSVAGKKVHDCAGLIKGYLWSSSPTASPKYNSKQDFGCTGFYNKAKKKGKISTFKKIAGQLVFKGNDKTKTHVGVYIGGNLVIEAKGHKWGVISSKLSTGGWKYWAQCHLIKDDTSTKSTTTASTSASKTASGALIEENILNPELIFVGDYEITAEHGLNLREGAGTSNPVITCMPYGSKCFCAGIYATIDEELWLKVIFGEHSGWCIAQYLKKEDE